MKFIKSFIEETYGFLPKGELVCEMTDDNPNVYRVWVIGMSKYIFVTVQEYMEYIEEKIVAFPDTLHVDTPKALFAIGETVLLEGTMQFMIVRERRYKDGKWFYDTANKDGEGSHEMIAEDMLRPVLFEYDEKIMYDNMTEDQKSMVRSMITNGDKLRAVIYVRDTSKINGLYGVGLKMSKDFIDQWSYFDHPVSDGLKAAEVEVG